MHKFKLLRRHFISLAAIGTAFAALKKTNALDKFFSLFTPPQRAVNPVEDKQTFLKLSAILLGVEASSLDPRLSDLIWENLQAEIAFQKDLIALIDESQAWIKEGKTLENLNGLSEPLTSITQTVIQTWYTGVVEFSKTNRKRIFYEESLMYAFFSSTRTPPGNCSGAFGDWSKLPVGVVQSTQPLENKNV